MHQRSGQRRTESFLENLQELEGIFSCDQDVCRQNCQQESHADKTTDDFLLKKPKQKYKSPSTVARDRARSLRFWKNFKKNFKKKSSQTNSLNNARRQPEDTILEQENTVHIESDSSGACNLISSQPDPDLDISNLSDSHELVHSPEVPLVAFTKTRNGTERDGTKKRRNRRNITEQIIMEYGTKTEQTECEKTEQAERNGTEYYGIRNTDGTFGLQMVGTIRNTIIRYTEHGTHLRNAIITVRNVKGC